MQTICRALERGYLGSEQNYLHTLFHQQKSEIKLIKEIVRCFYTILSGQRCNTV